MTGSGAMVSSPAPAILPLHRALQGGAGHKVAAGSVDDENAPSFMREPNRPGMKWEQSFSSTSQSAMMVLVRSARSHLPKKDRGSSAAATTILLQLHASIQQSGELLLYRYPLFALILSAVHPFAAGWISDIPAASGSPQSLPSWKAPAHFLFQLPDSIGQAGLRNIELLHCMADGGPAPATAVT